MKALILSLGLSLLAQGCAADTAADAEQDVTSGSLSAVISTVKVQETFGTCTVDVDYLQVKTGSAAVDAAINKELEMPLSALVDKASCSEESSTQEGGASVVLNQQGVLSTTQGLSYYAEGAAHPGHMLTAHNFDLRTGKPLALAEILEPSGIKMLVDACTKVYAAEELDHMAETCANNETFLIEPSGIRFIQPDVAHVIFALGVEGQLISYKDLEGKIKSPLIKAIAAAAPTPKS